MLKLKKQSLLENRLELLNNTLKLKNNNVYYKYKKTLKGYILYKMCYASWLDKETYHTQEALLNEVKALINDYKKEV